MIGLGKYPLAEFAEKLRSIQKVFPKSKYLLLTTSFG
jgi:hypothetical protein